MLHHREGQTLFTERTVTLVSPEGERREVRIRARSGAGKRVLAKITGVDTPEAAAALMGWAIVVERATLPPPGKDEYYIHDLLDLPVFEESGAALGTLADVVNGPAHDVWVIATDEGEAFVLATPENVAAFKAAGIAASEKMRFEREGKRPDGTPVHVAFSLAFARDKGASEARFFTCQQHYPQNFWNPAFQQHANGATGIGDIVMVANEPARHRDFLQAYTGAAAVSTERGGLRVELPRGAIDVLTPDAYTARYDLSPPDTSNGPRLAAMRFAGSWPERRRLVGALGAGLIFGRD